MQFVEKMPLSARERAERRNALARAELAREHGPNWYRKVEAHYNQLERTAEVAHAGH